MTKHLRFELTYQFEKRLERLEMFVAWHLPRWLVKWTVVRAYAKASQIAGDKYPDELTYSEVANAVHQLP